MTNSEIISFCAKNYTHIYPQFNLESAVFVSPSSTSMAAIVESLMTPITLPLEWPKGWEDKSYLIMSNYKLSTKKRMRWRKREDEGPEELQE